MWVWNGVMNLMVRSGRGWLSGVPPLDLIKCYALKWYQIIHELIKIPNSLLPSIIHNEFRGTCLNHFSVYANIREGDMLITMGATPGRSSWVYIHIVVKIKALIEKEKYGNISECKNATGPPSNKEFY